MGRRKPEEVEEKKKRKEGKMAKSEKHEKGGPGGRERRMATVPGGTKQTLRGWKGKRAMLGGSFLVSTCKNTRIGGQRLPATCRIYVLNSQKRKGKGRKLGGRKGKGEWGD